MREWYAGGARRRPGAIEPHEDYELRVGKVTQDLRTSAVETLA